MIFLLWESLGSMRIPVAVYTMAIAAMVISGVIRRQNIKWYIPMIAGVVLFMISDAGIAINKFAAPFTGADYFIMSTYMVAQYLIVRGIVEKNYLKADNLSPAISKSFSVLAKQNRMCL